MVSEVCLLGTTPIVWHCKTGRGGEKKRPATLPSCNSLTRFWETVNTGCSKADIRLRETRGVGPCNRYVHRPKGINYFHFILGLNFIFLCFWVWLCMIMSLKQKKVKFKLRIKLNRNICIHSLAKKIDHGLHFTYHGNCGTRRAWGRVLVKKLRGRGLRVSQRKIAVFTPPDFGCVLWDDLAARAGRVGSDRLACPWRVVFKAG